MASPSQGSHTHIHTLIHTYGQFSIYNSPMPHVFWIVGELELGTFLLPTKPPSRLIIIFNCIIVQVFLSSLSIPIDQERCLERSIRENKWAKSHYERKGKLQTEKQVV